MTQKVKLQPYSNQVNFQPRVASDLRDKTITDQCMSPMMIHKIIPSVDYNYWLKRLDT